MLECYTVHVCQNVCMCAYVCVQVSGALWDTINCIVGYDQSFQCGPPQLLKRVTRDDFSNGIQKISGVELKMTSYRWSYPCRYINCDVAVNRVSRGVNNHRCFTALFSSVHGHVKYEERNTSTTENDQ